MKEMERLFAQLTELSRRLERPLKDLDDIKGAIDILRKTRDLELDMDDAIDPIEVRQWSLYGYPTYRIEVICEGLESS